MFLSLLLGCFASSLCIAELRAAENVDLNKVVKQIGKEPNYTSKKPLYALAVFGAEAKTSVWMVLDKTKADAASHDVLYIDLNANGDLTDAGERIVDKKAKNGSSHFDIPNFTDPNGGATHTEINLGLWKGAGRLRLAWRGKNGFSGGYPVASRGGATPFGTTVKEAPVLWFNGDGPFRFQPWNGDKLTIGAADEFNVFVGQKGIGKNSFSSFSRHALPADDVVQATLIYQDHNGKEQRVIAKLKGRC